MLVTRAKSQLSIDGSFTQEKTQEWERAVGKRKHEEEGVVLLETLKSFRNELTKSVEYGEYEETDLTCPESNKKVQEIHSGCVTCFF